MLTKAYVYKILKIINIGIRINRYEAIIIKKVGINVQITE